METQLEQIYPRKRPCSAERHEAVDACGASVKDLLLSMAAHNEQEAPTGCAAVLTLMETFQVVQHRLLTALQLSGVTGPKLGTLVVLQSMDPEPSSAANLADRTRVTRSSMTAILDGLEASGWIRRQRVPSDRRAINVSLTDEGRVQANAIIRQFLAHADTLGARLSSEDINHLDTICHSLRSAGHVHGLPAVAEKS